jgi:fumarate reductase flavoprotein subunit
MTAAADIGAKLVNLDSFYGHLLSADVFHNDRLWPYPILDPLVEVGIVVDRHGDRFTNERLGGIDVTNKLARRPDPFGYVVCDNDAWNGPATQMSFPPPIRPWLEANGGAVMRADTIKGLAESTGMVLERLAASVDRFNRTQDSDVFSSSPTPTAERQIYAGPMPTGPSRIAEPPFVAIPVVPGITFTMGGPLVDINARVLHQSGGLIEGLYAAGASCGGFDGGADVGYVGGLMKAAITGVVAAEHVHRALLTKL